MSSASVVVSAAVDGRARSPRYIQRQLRRLHETLIQHAQVLQDAVVADSHIDAHEAALEYSLAVATVRQRFTEIDVRLLLEDEYRVAAGRDWHSRRNPVGIVYIRRPQGHAMLYSIVSALSSAIAAGNCVIIEVRTNLLETPRVLQKALSEYLDTDTIGFVESLPEDSVFLKRALVVDQGGDEPPSNNSRALRAPPTQTRVVAIVDRSADIAEAAKQVVEARVAFRGRSPYAPDVVLVNEFAIDDFTQAAVGMFTRHLSGSHDIKTPESRTTKPRRKGKEDVLSRNELDDPETVVVLSGDNGSLVKIGNRKLPVLSKKITSPDLIVHPVSSLDDAVDFANSPNTPLLASYHFAALPAAKYTSQFVESHVSFVNHLPVELQVGPPAPLDFCASAVDRYRPEMFSIATPLCVQPSKLSLVLKTAGNVERTRRSERSILHEMAHAPLPPDDQRDGKVVGFFDQGLITGAATVLTPVIGILAIGSYHGVRFALKRWRS